MSSVGRKHRTAVEPWSTHTASELIVHVAVLHVETSLPFDVEGYWSFIDLFLVHHICIAKSKPGMLLVDLQLWGR